MAELNSALLAKPELIEGLAELEAIEDEWRELAEQTGNAFVTPEWYRAWFDVYGRDARPAVSLVRRSDGSLAGVIPMARTGSGARSRTRFGGANLGDLFHPLVSDPGDDDAIRACAAALLGAHRSGTVVLDNVETAATWPSELAAAPRVPLTGRHYRGAVLPYIELGGLGSWDDYLATRSRNARSQLRRYERNLHREFDDVTLRRTDDPAALRADLDVFFRLHYARWEDRGGSSSAGDRVQDFHARFAAAALERGWLRLWFLDVGGKPVAAWYGWSLGGRYSYYLAGFDPDWAKHRVGHVLLCHTIKEAISEGASEYDMLLGDEDYKSRFATAERTAQTTLLTPPRSIEGAAAGAETGLWRLSRRLTPERRALLRERLKVALDLLPGKRVR